MVKLNAVAVLSEARRVYVNHAALVVGAAGVLQAAQAALSLLAMNTWGPVTGAFAVILLSTVTAQLTIGAYTLLLLHLRAGHHLPTIGYLIKEAGERIAPLFVLALLSGLGILLGSMLFILPGIYLALRWSVAAPALVARQLSATEAMKTSTELTKPAMGTVFLVVLVQGLCSFGFGQLAAASGNDFAAEDAILLQALVSTIFLPFASLAIGELFFALSGFAPTSEASGQAAIAPYLPAGAPAPAPAPYGTAQPAAGAYVPAMPHTPLAQPQPAAYAQPTPQPQPYAHPAPYVPPAPQPAAFVQAADPFAQPAPAPLPAPAAAPVDRPGSVAPPGFG